MALLHPFENKRLVSNVKTHWHNHVCFFIICSGHFGYKSGKKSPILRCTSVRGAHMLNSLSPATHTMEEEKLVSRFQAVVRLTQTKELVDEKNKQLQAKKKKKTCMCSPSTHPGSFRCSLHKKGNKYVNTSRTNQATTVVSHVRRLALTNSLQRIGTIERALVTLIRPSSSSSLHHNRRRSDFKPTPTRLSIMSKAQDL